MPEPIRTGQRYMPGLDGLRALAVLFVVAYHVGFGWAPGGLLGVGVFFTLSGYLITDLLLAHRAAGNLRLADFWLRRARRLLPGLFVMLVVVVAWVTIADRSQLAEVRSQVLASSVYVSNWWQVSQHLSYFARFGAPSPLTHLWSLAVEEQFYVVWPSLLLLGIRFVRERKRGLAVRPRLAGVTVALALVSAIEMALIYHPTFDPSRVYDGTDTRAFGLLFGAALAMVWPSRLLTRRVSPRARSILDCFGTAGLVTVVLLVLCTNQYSPFLYRGGLVLLSVATVLVVAAVAHPATKLSRLLAWGPLCWLGVRSYGIYLWHFPVIMLTSPTAAGAPNVLRASLQIAASVGLAALSWRFVEEPVRHGALGVWWAHAKSIGWRPRNLARGPRTALMGALGTFAVAGIGLATASPATQPGPGGTPVVVATRAAATSRVLVANSAGSMAASSTRTACRSVVHIGDSTSEGMVSSDYLPDRAQRLSPQYTRVGATQQHLDIQGATSIVETLPGGTNAYQVASQLIHQGYRGCWVIAVGLNDAADVYVGSSVGLTGRINKMMSVIGNQPVLWVNVKSLVASGPYSEDNMRLWNNALSQACSSYPNMRIFDWASVVEDGWFIADGTHYNSPGYAARAHLIAGALAQAFPASERPSVSGCTVGASPGPPASST